MDYKNFFLVNNSSGSKTKEDFLKKNHIEIYDKINTYIKENNFPTDLPFKEKIFVFINEIKEEPKCNSCGKQLKFKKSLKEGYGKYCSIKCNNQSEEQKNKIKNTFNQKYGGHPMKDEKIKDKIKETNLKKYGVDNIFKDSKYIISKTVDKLGVTNPNKLKEVKEKRVKTNLEKYGVSNTLLLDKYRDKNQVSKLKDFDEKYKSLDIINNKGESITIKCNVCENNYDIDRDLLFYRFKNFVNSCTLCNSVNELKSIKEKEIGGYIKSLGFTVISGDRKILNGKEIDLVIPDKKIGIEFNGLYYHSDLFKEKNYHIDKTEESLSKGYRLIHIFEDEWDLKKDIVKSRISNLLGVIEKRIFARKCVIKEVPTNVKTIFLNENHIQGTVGSKINYGLYYENELVSIMTFGQGRKIMNGLNYEWELLRFSNKINTTVVGGASKLLKHFLKIHNPNNLISYADMRWSNGNLYEVLGFKKIKISPPNYFYVVNKKRVYRYKFRKDILVSEGFDKDLTEFEIMSDRGINKIYDCGNIVYSLK
jgi:hypothetical protein